VYGNNTLNFLSEGMPRNAERFGITPDEFNLWSGIMTRWNPLYALYSDKANARTQVVVAQLQGLVDEFNALNQSKHLLDRIAASPEVTVADLKIFNIKGRESKRSVAVQPIQEAVNVSVQLLGGGSVTVRCHGEGSLRPSIIDAADSIQYVYLVGTTPPESADIPGLSKDISTKASFTLSLGSGSSSKYLYIYFRWYNTKHPELAGPWSGLLSTLIV